MIATLKLPLTSFAAFCAVAFICNFLNISVFQSLVRGEDQGQKSTNQNVDRKDDETSKKTRVDLGGGLESIETTVLGNGQAVSIFKTFKRHGMVVMRYSSHPTFGKGMRLYYHKGRAVMYEEFDNDGNIEMLMLLDTDGSPAEVFERKKDGTTHPVSTDRLEEFKRGVKSIENIFGPIANATQKGDTEKALQLIDEAVENLHNDETRSSHPTQE